ncbi:MAG: anti-sigma factor [Xanthobacteraceae bacterium]|jgi:anti-sigma-K factor RskA
MYDDDRDALAAEYVLGTLSTDERDQAEALLAIDPGFAEIVRVWERRLGELNVMVEAVEPPSDVWDKIKGEIGLAGASFDAAQSAGSSFEEAAPPTTPDAPIEMTAETAMAPEPEFELAPEEPATDFLAETPQDLDAVRDLDTAQDLDTPIVPHDLDVAMPPRDLEARDLEESSEVAALASSLLPAEPESEAPPQPVVAQFASPPEGRTADVIRLQRGVRRWRGVTAAMSAIAALLAVFIAVTQFAPGLIPLNRQAPPLVAANPQAPSHRFVAVLQQEPTAPAFLLTVDPQARTFTVRRVSATPEAGRSYELWLLPSKSPSPRSLGVVGADEFTTRPIPAGFDVDAMRGAGYAVSLEPAGGSPSGAPTGPILFTGSMVESLPGARS